MSSLTRLASIAVAGLQLHCGAGSASASAFTSHSSPALDRHERQGTDGADFSKERVHTPSTVLPGETGFVAFVAADVPARITPAQAEERATVARQTFLGPTGRGATLQPDERAGVLSPLGTARESVAGAGRDPARIRTTGAGAIRDLRDAMRSLGATGVWIPGGKTSVFDRALTSIDTRIRSRDDDVVRAAASELKNFTGAVSLFIDMRAVPPPAPARPGVAPTRAQLVGSAQALITAISTHRGSFTDDHADSLDGISRAAQRIVTGLQPRGGLTLPQASAQLSQLIRDT